MVAMEKRYPRESFTKKLSRLCEKLDQAYERIVEYKNFLGEVQSRRVTISSLWVVGSYARGALECGDLDVVIKLTCAEGGEPMMTSISKTFFGSTPLVRFYSGTPEGNTSGVAFPDVVRVWSGEGCDWKAVIESIPLDPNAGKAARDTDCIPLRSEQLRAYPDDLQEVAKQINERLLESEFVPFDTLMVNPLTDDEIEQVEQRRFQDLGKKSRELLPALVRAMAMHEPHGVWSGYDAKSLRCGGTEIRLGIPTLDLACFDTTPAVRQLALVPHYSARGPNGAWLLRRGPKHPDMIAIANRHAFISSSDGSPSFFYSSDGYWGRIRVMELDQSEDEAEGRLADWSDGEEVSVQIIEMTGRELLPLICSFDALVIGEQEFAVTWDGRHFVDQEPATLAEIVAALPVAASE